MKNKKHSPAENIFYILKTLWKGSPFFIVLTFIKNVGEGVFGAFFGIYLTTKIFAAIENGTDFPRVLAVIAALCLCHVVIHIISATHQYLTKLLMPNIYSDFYNRVIRQSISLDYTQFEDPKFYDKYTRALNECRDRALRIIINCSDVAGNIAGIIARAIIIAGIDPVLLLLIIPAAAVSLIFGNKCDKLYYELDMSNTKSGRTSEYAKRVFYEKKYAAELRLFPIGGVLIEKQKKAYDEICAKTKEIFRKIQILEVIRWLSFNFISSIIPYLYVGIKLHGATQGYAGYIAVISGLAGMTWQVMNTSMLATDLIKDGMFADNLREFLAKKPKRDPEGLEPAPALGDIEIKNMSFTYSGAEKPVLSDLNISIKKGEKIAIVGHNGAGKTTFVKLLMGLYEPTSGEIIMSGKNISRFEPKSFHARFGTVFQDLQVFALTLAQNVLMHTPKNEEERKLCEDALVKAQFGDKLSGLEKGIDTMVTKEFDEKGMGLSGGEAQKIAIARVFARKPDIVILDEPSSALDPIAEYNMYENMMTAAAENTVIFISHRLSATIGADRIYMFENGKIIESGNHSELLRLNGKYAEMWHLQAQNYLAE